MNETNTPPIHLHIQGHPAPQGSKRHIGNGRMIEQSKKLPTWRNTLILHMRNQYKGPPLNQPLHITATFYMPRPKHPKYPTPAVTPDLDKLARALGDALTQARIIKDDARITDWTISKRYHPTGWTGVKCTITPTT
ncbi:RusA family crossover junction endodeoxyribonuclease [Corynebacterium lizhenjunii]|uniref:RusA family crossover junction endodeoxyribonuclease n=1 Tax=Corynebacterium lizhenjunii TaxID=2709394 RepID=UPI0013EE1B8D|nr:RusA family crossover junction endodeoxyribonuclease [Corynebacterium lizhenjunii]